MSGPNISVTFVHDPDEKPTYNSDGQIEHQSTTYPSAINSSGQIVGYYTDADGLHGFLLSDGIYTRIDGPDTQNQSDAIDINDSGTIALYGNDADARLFGYAYDGGTFTGISDPNASSSGSSIYKIDNAGQVLGYYRAGMDGHDFLYKDGAYTEISDPNATFGTTAQDINDQGTVVGQYIDGSGYHAFIDDKGVYGTVENPTAPGQLIVFSSVNDAGDIIGTYYDDHGGGHGFLYKDGAFSEIKDPDAEGGTYLAAINDADQIVGSYDGSDGLRHAFVDSGGVFTTIDDPHAAGGSEATDINDAGQVIVYGSSALPCYCAGTRILTARGEVPVERLAIDDVALTAGGGRRSVTWIGHRHLDLARHANPKSVWPVRIGAGAFGDDLPARDLWISPGHNVFVGGVLIPVRVLVNGATITQERVDAVTYWHVELDAHDVILAEGLPAESYLDTGNRSAFENAGAFLELHPDFEPKHWAETCAPIHKTGSKVETVKAALLARARVLGHRTTATSDLHILADGRRVEPVDIGSRRVAFYLPSTCESVTLASRTFVPSHVRPASTDDRVLGIAVRELRIDGVAVDLRTMTAPGWHAPEEHATHVRRWTDGSGLLPTGARLVTVDVVGEGRYWVGDQDRVVASCGEARRRPEPRIE